MVHGSLPRAIGAESEGHSQGLDTMSADPFESQMTASNVPRTSSLTACFCVSTSETAMVRTRVLEVSTSDGLRSR